MKKPTTRASGGDIPTTSRRKIVMARPGLSSASARRAGASFTPPTPASGSPITTGGS